jgi:hypothetical protein
VGSGEGKSKKHNQIICYHPFTFFFFFFPGPLPVVGMSIHHTSIESSQNHDATDIEISFPAVWLDCPYVPGPLPSCTLSLSGVRLSSQLL